MWGVHSGAYFILPGDKEHANKSFFTASHGLELNTMLITVRKWFG